MDEAEAKARERIEKLLLGIQFASAIEAEARVDARRKPTRDRINHQNNAKINLQNRFDQAMSQIMEMIQK